MPETTAEGRYSGWMRTTGSHARGRDGRDLSEAGDFKMDWTKQRGVQDD
ncbi:MAG: hypothetical protein V5A55_03325 [Halovenus sp.]